MWWACNNAEVLVKATEANQHPFSINVSPQKLEVFSIAKLYNFPFFLLLPLLIILFFILPLPFSYCSYLSPYPTFHYCRFTVPWGTSSYVQGMDSC